MVQAGLASSDLNCRCRVQSGRRNEWYSYAGLNSIILVLVVVWGWGEIWEGT